LSLHLFGMHTGLARKECWHLFIGTQYVTDTILISPHINSSQMKKWIVLLPPFYMRNMSSRKVKHHAQGHIARNE
ncbi:hypothetical protein ACQP3J_32525, partial [Escherichia coli]